MYWEESDERLKCKEHNMKKLFHYESLFRKKRKMNFEFYNKNNNKYSVNLLVTDTCFS